MANIRLNYTAFTSASMALKITAAMSHCLSTGEVVRVANHRGKAFLLVAIIKDRLGYTFSFRSMYDDAEVGELILRAHHEWPESSSNYFWQLAAASYDLTMHPFITVSKQALETLERWHINPEDEQAAIYILRDRLEQQRTVDQIHKQAGATHKATDSLGRVVYLSYKRSWFGLGKTTTFKHVLEVSSVGLWDEYKMKVNGESFTIQGVL